MEKDEGAALFTGRCFFVFPHRTRGKWPDSTLIWKGGPDGAVRNLPERNENRPLPGKNIVLESLTPVLSPKEKEKRKKEIERCLYDVFSKYRQSRR